MQLCQFAGSPKKRFRLDASGSRAAIDLDEARALDFVGCFPRAQPSWVQPSNRVNRGFPFVGNTLDEFNKHGMGPPLPTIRLSLFLLHVFALKLRL